MCKRHDAEGYKRALQDVMQRGFVGIEQLNNELKRLFKEQQDLEGEELAKNKVTLSHLNHIAVIVHDILHPGFTKALDIFPIDNHVFIKQCMQVRSDFKEKGLQGACSCCK